MAEDDSTKLIIYGLGLATVLFFIYLAYKEYRTFPPDIGSMYAHYANSNANSNVQILEQKLIQLEDKIDAVYKSLKSDNTERKTVSLNPKFQKLTKVQEQKAIKDMFDMQ